MERTISNNANSLANGKVGKLLWKYALPCVIALLITALYNVVDQIFIGNSAIGSIGNTATTVVFPITILALALSYLLAMEPQLSYRFAKARKIPRWLL
jgi:Na+-driven multidrug efflux pump